MTQTFLNFAYFNAKTNPSVLGREKTETAFKIPQPPNTSPDSVLGMKVWYRCIHNVGCNSIDEWMVLLLAMVGFYFSY